MVSDLVSDSEDVADDSRNVVECQLGHDQVSAAEDRQQGSQYQLGHTLRGSGFRLRGDNEYVIGAS